MKRTLRRIWARFFAPQPKYPIAYYVITHPDVPGMISGFQARGDLNAEQIEYLRRWFSEHFYLGDITIGRL